MSVIYDFHLIPYTPIVSGLSCQKIPKWHEPFFSDYLEGLINLDEEMKKPENIDPYFRNMEGVGGIHFWQLQEFIEELELMS